MGAAWHTGLPYQTPVCCCCCTYLLQWHDIETLCGSASNDSPVAYELVLGPTQMVMVPTHMVLGLTHMAPTPPPTPPHTLTHTHTCHTCTQCSTASRARAARPAPHLVRSRGRGIVAVLRACQQRLEAGRLKARRRRVAAAHGERLYAAVAAGLGLGHIHLRRHGGRGGGGRSGAGVGWGVRGPGNECGTTRRPAYNTHTHARLHVLS